MPVRVVLSHPDHHALRMVWRGLSASMGCLMVLAGLAALLTTFALTFLLVATLASADSKLPDTSALAAPWAIATTLMLSGLVVGYKLLRGTRHSVLFLRRFGYGEATRAITFAVARTIGRSWRLVTLDDAAIAPVGVAAGTTRLFRVGSAIGKTLMVAMAMITRGFLYVAAGAFAGLVVLGVITIRRHEDLHTLFDYPRTTAFGYPRPEVMRWDVPTTFYVLLVVLVVALIVGLLFAPLVAIAVIALFPILAVFWVSVAALERAEGLKVARVSNVQEIGVAAELLTQESRKIFAPRLVVLSVASNVWHEAVRSLAMVASVVLIDVSEPSQNLLWEIDETSRIGSKCMFVGHYDRVRGLVVDREAAASPESIDARLSISLEGQEVLAYTTDRRGMKRFARALRDKLETLPRT
jgi:hypothetical protein